MILTFVQKIYPKFVIIHEHTETGEEKVNNCSTENIQ